MTVRTIILEIVSGAAILATTANPAWSQSREVPNPPPTAPLAPTVAAKPVAVVDDQVITLGDLEALLQSRGPTPVTLTETQRRQMKMEALGMMIDDILMQKFLRQKGPRIDPAEVDKQMVLLLEALKKQNKTLADFCKESGQSEANLRDNQTLMLQWAAFVRARVSDADLKRYFDDNKDFFNEVLVRASHIVIRTPSGMPESELLAARTRLLVVRQEIIAGRVDFATAAAKHSQCSSAQNGGDLGVFPRKFAMDEVFAKTAFAVPVGHISDLVQTSYGLHLIKVTERTPGKPADLEKIKDVVRSACVEDLRQNLLAELRKTAKVQIDLP